MEVGILYFCIGISLYFCIGISWMLICLYKTMKLEWKRTWRTYLIGCPFNMILWPISMVMALSSILNR